MAELPTKEQIEALPARAIAAFADRCAQRVYWISEHPEEFCESKDFFFADKVGDLLAKAANFPRLVYSQSDLSSLEDSANSPISRDAEEAKRLLNSIEFATAKRKAAVNNAVDAAMFSLLCSFHVLKSILVENAFDRNKRRAAELAIGTAKAVQSASAAADEDLSERLANDLALVRKLWEGCKDNKGNAVPAEKICNPWEGEGHPSLSWRI